MTVKTPFCKGFRIETNVYRASHLDITNAVSQPRTDYALGFTVRSNKTQSASPSQNKYQNPTFIQRGILLLFTWCSAPLTSFFILAAALPIILLVLMSPILMASGSLMDILGELSYARAVANGSAELNYEQMPLYTLLLMAADWLAVRVPLSGEGVSAGRVYLISKSLFSLGTVFALCLTLNVRLPILAAMGVTWGVVLVALNPLGDATVFSSVILIVLLLITLCAPSIDTKLRALSEGIFCGVVLTGLLLTMPVMFFMGVIALTACPYLSGQYRGVRYLMFVGSFIFSSIALFLVAPDLFSKAIEALINWGVTFQNNLIAVPADWFKAFGHNQDLSTDIFISLIVLVLVFVSVMVVSNIKAMSVLFASFFVMAIALFLTISESFSSLILMKLSMFLAVIILCFAVKTPLYKEIYNRPSRAAYSTALLLVGLVFIQGMFVLAPLSDRLVKQYQFANHLDTTIQLSSLEKRFSIMLMDKHDMHQGLEDLVLAIDEYQKPQTELAILTEFDFLCMLETEKACFQNGQEAAKQANIIFVPHITFGSHTQATLEKSQAFLYTHFKRTNQTRHWDVWERRSQ